MAHNNRKPNMLPYTMKDFQKQFPDDATCLEWLKNRNSSLPADVAQAPEPREKTPIVKTSNPTEPRDAPTTDNKPSVTPEVKSRSWFFWPFGKSATTKVSTSGSRRIRLSSALISRIVAPFMPGPLHRSGA